MRTAPHVIHFSVSPGFPELDAVAARIRAATPWIQDTLAGLAMIAFMIAAFDLASTLQGVL